MTKKNQQSMNSTSARPMGKGLLLSVIPLLLAGCGALQPVPYTQDEIQKRVSDDRSIMYSAQEPISKPVTFYEATARALKYNLDYRLKLMENALTRSLHDVASFEMLPRLVAGAHWGQDDYIGGVQMALLALDRGLPVSAWGNDSQCSGGIHQLKITRSFNP